MFLTSTGASMNSDRLLELLNTLPHGIKPESKKERFIYKAIIAHAFHSGLKCGLSDARKADKIISGWENEST